MVAVDDENMKKSMVDFENALKNNDKAKIVEISTSQPHARWTFKTEKPEQAAVTIDAVPHPGGWSFPMAPPGFIGLAAGIKSKYSVLAIQNLYASGADLDGTTSENVASIHLAARQQNHEAVECLINLGANLEAESQTGKTAIQFAAWMGAETGDTRCLKLLLEGGANVNAKNSSGRTAIHWALFGVDPEALELLLKHPSVNKDAKYLEYSDKNSSTNLTVVDQFNATQERYVEYGEEGRAEMLELLRQNGLSPVQPTERPEGGKYPLLTYASTKVRCRL
ncbi:hypothetical protein AOL_s00091g25 [Orbilia oligospora ATCC 24927]|uniref:Uncharacterized protein n=1 Tax=Arthrobotrys oligospora (strain ATCC 24927 / CBS 115.81 / DSM 1491) TaxID=756982 RepID=G1XHX3_ARTOA|nr:hypothetical protein AOL_s00091g25 [Orbilia oligospora ATCC 24927]EGX47204.1 hypothetical protein AOL_s00091g25 [Orbilia oligospora ATCC 24927]